MTLLVLITLFNFERLTLKMFFENYTVIYIVKPLN